MVEELKSKRLEGIGEYYFSQKLRQIAEMNESGLNVLNLGIGSPDMKPPLSAQKAIVDGLQEPTANQYQSYRGIPELRNAFADWYAKYFDVNMDQETEMLP